MITPWTVYCIGILDSLNEAASALAFFSGAVALLVGVMTIVFTFVNELPEKDSIKRKLIIRGNICALCIFLVSATVTAFLPSTKLAASMYLIPAVVNNEDMRQISGNALKGLKKMTEQWLLEMAEDEVKDIKKDNKVPDKSDI